MIIELALIIVIIICIITEIIKYAYPDSVHLIRGHRKHRKQGKQIKQEKQEKQEKQGNPRKKEKQETHSRKEAFEEKNMFNYNISNQRYILH